VINWVPDKAKAAHRHNGFVL